MDIETKYLLKWIIYGFLTILYGLFLLSLLSCDCGLDFKLTKDFLAFTNTYTLLIVCLIKFIEYTKLNIPKIISNFKFKLGKMEKNNVINKK